MLSDQSDLSDLCLLPTLLVPPALVPLLVLPAQLDLSVLHLLSVLSVLSDQYLLPALVIVLAVLVLPD